MDQVCVVVLLQIGQIMHTNPKPWRVDASMAGTMLAPVLFAMLIVLASVILLALYLVLQVRRLCPWYAIKFWLSVFCHVPPQAPYCS